MLNTTINEIVNKIKCASNIVVLTGAGMSTESGVPDFRSAGGLYSSELFKGKYRPEDVLSKNFFYYHPVEFYEYVKKNFILNGIEPNIGHKILAKWEAAGKVKAIVTQNIDGLHQDAGSKNVFEVHGTIRTASCQRASCHKQYTLEELFARDKTFYKCECGKYIKPDIVLYGENIKHFRDSKLAVSNADMLLILGTSMTVYPIADLPVYLKKGMPIVIINYTPTQYDYHPNAIVINEGIGKTLETIDNYLS